MPVSTRGKQRRWPAADAPYSSSGAPSAAGSTQRDVRAVVGAETAQRWLDNRDGGRAVSLWRRGLRLLWQRCNRLNAPVVYPWSPSQKGAAPVHDLHRVAAAVLRHHSNTFFGTGWRWTKAVVWPALASAAILPLLFRFGRYVHASHGRSWRRQFADLWRAAWLHGIFPTEYYHHQVFRGARDRDLVNYLSEREIQALIWAADRGANVARVDNLRRLLSEVRASGLAAPRLVAAFHGGEIAFCCDTTLVNLPERDLFLRPETWDGGVAGQQWRWNVQARVWAHRDEALTAAALLQRGRKLSANRPWVIQESINNHPDIARFSAGGICTAQIVTGVDGQGVVQPLFGRFQIPASAETGWGSSAGELTAGIDLRDGRLGLATGEFVSDGEFAVHPGTRVTIDGAVIPEWHALLDLARRAHERVSEIPFVAWRVALTGSGPMLLEATSMWGVFRHVWPAETPFAALCQEHLARLGRGETFTAPRDGNRERGDLPRATASV